MAMVQGKIGRLNKRKLDVMLREKYENNSGGNPRYTRPAKS
jgi:hypothetical protein